MSGNESSGEGAAGAEASPVDQATETTASPEVASDPHEVRLRVEDVASGLIDLYHNCQGEAALDSIDRVAAGLLPQIFKN